MRYNSLLILIFALLSQLSTSASEPDKEYLMLKEKLKLLYMSHQSSFLFDESQRLLEEAQKFNDVDGIVLAKLIQVFSLADSNSLKEANSKLSLIKLEELSSKFLKSTYHFVVGFIHFMDHMDTKALDSFELALSVYPKNHYRLETYIIHWYRAKSLAYLSSYEEALEIQKRLLQLAKEHNFKYDFGQIYFDKGSSYTFLSDFTRGMDNWFRALNLFTLEEKYSLIVRVLNNIAVNKSYLGYADDSIRYYLQATEYFHFPEVTADQKALIYENLANRYIEKSDFEQARNFLKKAQTVAKNISQQDQKLLHLLSFARSHTDIKDIEIARKLEKEIDRIPKRFWLNHHKIYYYYFTAKLNYLTGDSLNATKMISQAIDLLKDSKSESDKKDVYLLAHDIFIQVGDYRRALESFRKYSIATQKIDNAKSQALSTNRELLYQKKQNILEKLSSEKKEQENRFLIIGLFTSFLFLAISTYFLIRNIQLRRLINSFYTSEKKLNLHFISQLEKVFYPHQIRKILQGKNLEDTMPKGEGRACVLAMDIVDSTNIDSEKKIDFLEESLRSCLSLLHRNYEPEDLISTGYRIKVVGDGFLAAVGFPFKSPRKESDAESAVILAIEIIELFSKIVRKFSLKKDVFCCIGLAQGTINGFFPLVGTKEYDLYGDGIVLATRYEGMRKLLFKEIDFNSIILQAEVYEKLSKKLQDKFSFVNLQELNLSVRDDQSAQGLYVYKSYQGWKNSEERSPTIVA